MEITKVNDEADLGALVRKIRGSGSANPHIPEWTQWIEDAKEAVKDVETMGISAVIKHNRKYFNLDDIRISRDNIARVAEKYRGTETYKALEFFYRSNLEISEVMASKFKKQVTSEFFDVGNIIKITYKVESIERIGIYTSPNFCTTLLHLLAMSIAAGVKPSNIYIVTYPKERGRLPDEMMIAAYIAGVEQLFLIRGRYAIASLALGLKGIIEPVDMIMGPGSPWIDAAKRYIAYTYGIRIDLPAGPSETAVIFDKSLSEDKRKLDSLVTEIMTQTEHSKFSKAFVLIESPNKESVENITNYIESALESSEDGNELVLGKSGQVSILWVEGMKKLIDLVNAIAPEYTVIMSENADFIKAVSLQLRNTGSLLVNVSTALSDYSPETCLSPTGGFAKGYSKLSVHNLMKIIPVLTKSGTGESDENYSKQILLIAKLEGFKNHQRSLRGQLGKIKEP